MDNFVWLGYLAIVFLVINSIIYRKGAVSKNRPLKLFTFYLISSCLIQLGATYVAKILHEPNLYFSHIYYISQFALLSLFYESLLKFKWLRIIMFVVLAGLAYQYIKEPAIIFEYNALGMSITHTLIVLYSVLYFYKSLQGSNEFITVNTGFFLYLLSSTLIFASGNLILKLDLPENTQYLLININRFLYVVFQVLIFIEWYRNYRIKT